MAKVKKVLLQEKIRTKLFPRYVSASGNDFVAFRRVEILRFPDLLHSPLFFSFDIKAVTDSLHV